MPDEGHPAGFLLAETGHDELAEFLTARYRLFAVIAGRLAAVAPVEPATSRFAFVQDRRGEQEYGVGRGVARRATALHATGRTGTP